MKLKCKTCGKEISKVNIKDHEEECLKGIEGWLIIFATNLYFISLGLFGYIFIFTDFIIQTIFSLLFIYSVYLIYLMHIKSRRFPQLMIYFLFVSIIVMILFLIIETFEMFFYLINPFPLIGSILGLYLWIEYLKNSRRVKNTFVN